MTEVNAPPWNLVPLLMKDLFVWLKRSKEVLLVKSCIFHFVFETIHPFPDGNGRMGRLRQTAILGRSALLRRVGPDKDGHWEVADRLGIW